MTTPFAFALGVVDRLWPRCERCNGGRVFTPAEWIDWTPEVDDVARRHDNGERFLFCVCTLDVAIAQLEDAAP